MLRFGIINRLAVTIILILLIANIFRDIPIWVYIVIILSWLTLTVIGSFHIRWNYHLNAHNRNKNSTQNHIAITFDDGPHPEFTPQVLELLKKYNAKATFFCIGKNIEAHPKLLSQIIANGHVIGNHTYSHSNKFGFFGTQKVVGELLQTNKIVKKHTGKEMLLYRPAFGVTNPNIKKAVNTTGHQPIGWSIRSLDTTTLSQNKVLQRISNRIQKGDIVLFHDTSRKTVIVLEQLLLFLQKKKLQSVTVEQLLSIKAYA